jgi:Putative Ig domain
MFVSAVTSEKSDVLISSGFKSPSLLIQRLGVLLLLLAVSFPTTSCGTAEAAGAQNTVLQNKLSLSGNLKAATVAKSYNAVFNASGGKPPYYFMVGSGTLPPGLHLNSVTGSLSGTPTAAGQFTFQVVVIDAPNLNQVYKVFALNVVSVSEGVTVGVTPVSASLSSGQQQQFTATVGGTTNTAVTWSATAGTISASGRYSAPSVNAQTGVTVTATSAADASQAASAAITVNPATTQTLQIATSSLPGAQQGDTYSEVFAATGGTAPYSWNVSAGTLPAGIGLAENGDFTGLPTTVGTFNFSATVTDSALATASGNFSVSVVAGSNFDGPAELPRVTVPSTMADTPAPGSIVNVNAGGDLQGALNHASCGDIIELQAGATFTGRYTLPAKGCDGDHWIILRTSAPDSALPAEGERATPCYAGVASLPGRPQYTCSSPKNVMAKVQVQTAGDGPFMMANGASFYRFVGLEITRPVGAIGPARLISPLHPSLPFTADHFVVDRSWLHGTTQDETHNGLTVNGMTNVAVVDSYFSDFHCISGTGACTDAHAISGGNSTTQDGPFKIQDNFLEASGEAILFGGGPATFSPSDIQILNNHFWKPWQWMPGNANFIGGANGHPFVVKNHVELKNAVRVLIEDNLMENNWGGFSQSGYAVLLTPLNQATLGGKGPFVCPRCQVTDITVRYTHISHAGGGIQMTTVEDVPTGKNGQPALAGARWSIHDVVLDDLSKQYVGGGTAFEIDNGWAKNPLNTVTINHVTAFPNPAGHMMIVGNPKGNAPMYGLVFTNNLIVTGQHPIWAANGAPGDCALADVPITTLGRCFTTYTFSNNALIASPTVYPPSSWPAHNLFPQTVEDVDFVTFDDADGGNYELQSASPYKNKGTDGKDLGADVVGLNAALANVE